MRLDLLRIDGFKNLNNVEIDFDQDQPSTVLIGVNGSGKSNVLEALVVIFRALDLKETIPFRCFLRYHCKGRWIEVDNRWSDGNTSLKLTVDGKAMSASQFAKSADDTMPSHVFGYYSGGSRRFESQFDKHQSRYYSSVIRPGSEAWTDPREPALRRLFYCRPTYGQLALLSYFAFPDEQSGTVLRDDMGIRSFYSALIVMKKPNWGKVTVKRLAGRGENMKSRFAASVVRGHHGDPHFWYATGVVRHLLDALWNNALAPIRISDSVTDDYRGQPSPEEHVYIYIKDLATLRQIAEPFGDSRTFFAMLETLEISDLLREVRIWVDREGAATELPFHEISDGEKQLLTVLGLMKFTGHDESLFLLDEPDTHLNPAWKWNYLQLIEKVAGPGSNSHVVMTTHDPLTIAGLTADQVTVMWRDDQQQVRATRPHVDPKGLGVSAILTQIFGMPTTLDPETQSELNERNRLLAIDDRTREQSAQLAEMNERLNRLGFLIESREPEYEAFLRAFAAARQDRPIYSPDQIAAQNQLAQEIVERLLAERRQQ
jgi:ABC-type multidrug transport system ATPase subunit